MTFIDKLSALPSAINGLTQAHVALLNELWNSDDRGGFYLAYANMLSQMQPTSNTSSALISQAIQQCIMQAHISTYSGFIGGAALLGNAIAKYSDPENYKISLDQFSKDIVGGLFAAIQTAGLR